jgi:hypothetical protein
MLQHDARLLQAQEQAAMHTNRNTLTLSRHTRYICQHVYRTAAHASRSQLPMQSGALPAKAAGTGDTG